MGEVFSNSKCSFHCSSHFRSITFWCPFYDFKHCSRPERVCKLFDGQKKLTFIVLLHTSSLLFTVCKSLHLHRRLRYVLRVVSIMSAGITKHHYTKLAQKCNFYNINSFWLVLTLGVQINRVSKAIWKKKRKGGKKNRDSKKLVKTASFYHFSLLIGIFH